MKKCMLLIFLISFISCTTNVIKQDGYFDKKEIEILEKTTDELNCDFGYNHKLDLNYIFIKTQEKQSGSDISKILSSYDDKTLYNYYYKVNQIYEINKVLLENSLKTKDWKSYNIIKSELMPGIELYLNVTSAYMKTEKESIYNDIEKQRDSLRRNAILYFKTKEHIVGEYK